MTLSAAKQTAGSRSSKSDPTCLSRSARSQVGAGGVEALLDDRRREQGHHPAVHDEDLAVDPLPRPGEAR